MKNKNSNHILIEKYIEEVSRICKEMKGTGDEHTHRKPLMALLEGLSDGVKTINEPPKNDVGRKLDITVLRNNRVIGYVECKGTDKYLLSTKDNKKQKEEDMRHDEVGKNYLYTNYLGFELYRGQECIASVELLRKKDNDVSKVSEYAVQDTIDLLKLFVGYEGIAPKKPRDLASMLSNYAKMLSDGFVARLEVSSTDDNVEIVKDYMMIQKRFLESLDYKTFSNLYAQTIIYGYIALYLHAKKEGKKLPSTLTFIKNLFKHIENVQEENDNSFGVGYNAIIKEVEWVLNNTDIEAIFTEYEEGKGTKLGILYFYEDFLDCFDKKGKKDKGVYYTPEPVVSFMVEALDSILENDFGIVDGLASEETIASHTEYKQRVKVLDLATGTGTFLIKCLEAIKNRYGNQYNKEIAKRAVERLNGFEISMASYTIAHLMMEYVLSKDGVYDSTIKFNIALTNSLENTNLEGADDILLRDEASKITAIRDKKPIMCIIGNPPYNAKSKNKGAYIEGLMKSYFREPNSINKLQERNSKNVNDDYCKFFRVAEKYIDSNKEGVLCYITNSGYLHNRTFRGMRWHLLQTFERIHIIDIVGENVFDIKTPTCIFIGIKRKERTNTLADVYYTSINGTREEVFKALRTPYNKHTYTKIDMIHPYYFFIPKALNTVSYPSFDSLNDIFMIKATSISTAIDGFIIAKKKDVLRKRIQEYIRGYDSPETLESKYGISIERARMLVDKRSSLKYDDNKIMNIAYRPFDNRYIYYERSILSGDRYDVMKHMIHKDNIGVIVESGIKNSETTYTYNSITKHISDSHLIGGRSYHLPLYIYDNDIQKDNIHPDYKAKIENIIGTTTTADDILAYIYGILHTPQYRTTYLEDLKIDYPRIPLPHSKEHYDAVIKLSKELIEYHLLKTKEQNSIIRSYTVVPNNTSQITVDIQKSSAYKDNKVYINKDCYVDNVSKEVYDVIIGGYQVAYTWLYKRNKETLDNDDIQEYRKILIALEAHVRIMKELDTVYKNTTIV